MQQSPFLSTRAAIATLAEGGRTKLSGPYLREQGCTHRPSAALATERTVTV